MGTNLKLHNKSKWLSTAKCTLFQMAVMSKILSLFTEKGNEAVKNTSMKQLTKRWGYSCTKFTPQLQVLFMEVEVTRYMIFLSERTRSDMYNRPFVLNKKVKNENVFRSHYWYQRK